MGEHLLFEDLEDLDISDSLSSASKPSINHALMSSTTRGTPIDLATAKSLRELVFGTATGPSFNAEWRRQNFVFCDLPKLEYGLIQHKGGPCGVLACVQAYVLKHLIFTSSENGLTSSPRPTQKERNSSLVAALTDILWKAGGQKSATVTLTTRGGLGHDKKVFSKHYKPDTITERLVINNFDSQQDLQGFIYSQLPLFQDNSSSGCICFLYSLILSRGIENVKSDMDSETNLLGAHNYCTQEIVNLILTGFAVSNVFNGQHELTGGNEKVVLRGVQQRSELGLLSLFEHYGSLCVGSNLKDPIFPIWVVSSESHFTVLFSHQRRLERKFDLHYYDGLAIQDEPIVLTIDNSGRSVVPSISDSDLVPPLELVIKTKWKLAAIDWNQTEPLL